VYVLVDELLFPLFEDGWMDSDGVAFANTMELLLTIFLFVVIIAFVVVVVVILVLSSSIIFFTFNESKESVESMELLLLLPPAFNLLPDSDVLLAVGVFAGAGFVLFLAFRGLYFGCARETNRCSEKSNRCVCGAVICKLSDDKDAFISDC